MLRVLVVLVLALVLPAGLHAHPWQADTPAVSDKEVAELVAALEDLGRDAQEEGWRPPAIHSADLLGAVYLYTEHVDGYDRLPHGLRRILTAYQAMVENAVDAGGNYTASADAFRWMEVLHPGDIPAVARQKAALSRIGTLFSVGLGE